MSNKNLNDLKNFGFEEAGEWYLSGDKLQYKLDDRFKNKRVIYAFVVEDEVKYIGICDSYNTTLQVRMDRYLKNLSETNRTNVRINEEIKKKLKLNHKVEIYALLPETKDKYEFNGISIDLIRGLEYPLIKKFNPEWNK
ncbi:MAG: GIY-YIG nuclease family protein [Endomicrobiia bacterium]